MSTAPPTNGQAKRTTLSERERGQLKFVENLSGIRDAFWNRLLNQGGSCDLRELWSACGYGDIDNINPQWYRTLYDTFSIANRICRLLPAETWQAPPSVYEDEDADTVTPFEEKWDNLPKDLASGGQTWYLDEQGSIIYRYLEDLDVLSGIGSFGVMLFGFDDGKNLQDPVDGIQVLDPNKSPADKAPKKSMPDTPFKSMKNGKVTEEQRLLNEDEEKGLIEPSMNYANPLAACNQVHNKVSAKDQYPNVPQKPQARDNYTQSGTSQSFKVTDHPDVMGRNPTAAGSGQAPPNQGYSDGTVGSPGAGPFVQGTDQQYERTSGMGMAFPAGAALSGTDQQYFGVQFGPSEEFGPPAKQERRLLFLRVFDESLVQVVRYEWNIRNPRFGLPVMYRITLNDPRTPHGGVGLPLATVYVHWSRVLHIPSGGSPVPSPIFGIPLMKPNLEHLLPLRKIYAADGQGYWKNAFSKLVLSTHPQLGGDVDIEAQGGRAQLQEDVDLFNDPMTNQALMLVGMGATTLPPSVTDPTVHCEVHLKAIALQMDVPYPVFQGYEIGEQASENNQVIWNNRKRGRQLKRNTFILVSFIDRLIAVGVLPAPQKQKKESKQEGKTVTGDPDFVQKPLRPPGSQQPAAPNGAAGGDKGGYTGPKGDWQAEQHAGAELKDSEQQAPQKPIPTANVRSLGVWMVRGKPKELFNVRRGRMIYACNAEGDIEVDDKGKPKAVGVVTEAGYSIEWPDVDALSVKDQAAVCLQQVQADAAFIAGGNDQMMTLKSYFTRYKKMTEEEAEAIIQETMEAQQVQQEQADQLAEEQGLEPIPPEGYQAPQDQIEPHVVVGPGETLHHADDIKPGSALKGQKQVPGAGPQQPFGGPPGAGGSNPFSGKKGKPTVNELVGNANPEGHNQYTYTVHHLTEALEALGIKAQKIEESGRKFMVKVRPSDMDAARTALEEFGQVMELGGGKLRVSKIVANELVGNADVTATELRDSLGRWIASVGIQRGSDRTPLGEDHLTSALVHADMADDIGHKRLSAAAKKVREAVADHERGEPLGVNKFHAMHETQFVHREYRNADGTPVRCRASGKCQTWKTRPNEFKLPVKHGLRDSFYITPENAHDWVPARSRQNIVRGAVFDLHQAVQHHLWMKENGRTENTLRSHHALKADLIAAGEELSKHELCMPGYGSIDVKNDGSGEVWWTGGDSDGEGFDDVVKERLGKIPGVTKVYYYIEVPPPREGGWLTGAGAESGYTSGAPLWDECWTNQGRDYQGMSTLPTLAELENTTKT